MRPDGAQPTLDGGHKARHRLQTITQLYGSHWTRRASDASLDGQVLYLPRVDTEQHALWLRRSSPASGPAKCRPFVPPAGATFIRPWHRPCTRHGRRVRRVRPKRRSAATLLSSAISKLQPRRHDASAAQCGAEDPGYARRCAPVTEGRGLRGGERAIRTFFCQETPEGRPNRRA